MLLLKNSNGAEKYTKTLNGQAEYRVGLKIESPIFLEINFPVLTGLRCLMFMIHTTLILVIFLLS